MRSLRNVAILCLFLGGGPTAAQAQENRELDAALDQLPVTYVERPLNLPAGDIRVDGRVDVVRLETASDTGTFEETYVDMNIGAAVGITPRIEVGVSSHRPAANGDGIGNWGPTHFGQGGAVPLRLSPDGPDFQSLQLYGRFGAAQSTDFDLSIDVGMMLPIGDGLPWVMFAGVPIRARLGPRFALDAAGEFSVAFSEQDDGTTDPSLSMHFPIAGVLSIVPQLYLAGRSGIFVPDMDFADFTIPLTLELGVTLAGDKPWVDLVASFGFPRLFQPGADDAVVSEYWVMSFGVNGFIDL